MPATLRSLLARRDLGLRLLTDVRDTTAARSSDVPIAWLHSSDLPDPTPFLAAGQALLTTGTQFGPDAEVPPGIADDYVRRLTAHGVVALGFGTEVVRAGTPDALVDACRTHGLPLFEVPYATSFIQVAQANAESVAKDANARDAWALAAQRAISFAAMRPDGLGATLAELSRQLDCWVGLLDVSGRIDRAFPPDGIAAVERTQLQEEGARLLRGGQRASLPVSTATGGFTLQTLGSGGHLDGVLAIATGTLDHAGREVVTAVIALAGLALQQNRELGRARGLLRTGLLTMLSSGNHDVVETTSRELWGPLPAAPVRVAAVHVDDEDRDAVVDLLELWVQDRPGQLFFAVDDALFLCIGADDDGVDTVRRLTERYDLHVGLSDGAAYGSFARARAEAVRALDRSLEGRPGIVEFGDLARDGVLAHLAHTDASDIARAFLAPLTDHDAAAGSDLTRTVRTWLEQDCEYDRAAQVLGVHRHTARARVAHAGRLLDRDLGLFATRADVWAAFVALSAD
ncbi:PucR family transcriptional regulator [Curtobacterium sp. MCLR17_007]|uniref:PucR family transcriptional regulator n=1 Tax=Curtobacterium sp. MCLR17_007 TaxID=2175648 RepID=UPI000DAAD136|nr:PucR family transcriptional regulator [Curtobacterium sp. MCLR17_007]WIB60267.1 PucR family transcriptional regulator [Curtobacterium sp. MCLR17_007]